ncbi:hypothetical protein DVH24_000966 [Malus domestica]|uniref:Uncharacterized protein n=1 Tax=Malus domestica TaxID=3750 RepID=A0A498K5X5_MALDO|nr:hypothetical protein DVH24_000966 [Malus domestica]
MHETLNVEAILFNWYDHEERPLNFKLMSNLIMLIVHDSPIFHFKSTPSIDLPDSLHYLYWWGYPLESLPLKFSPENLVDLHMPCRQVKKLWKEDQRPVNLQVLNLPGSIYLTEVPNLSRSLKIVNIDLSSCRRLVEIPWYFQDLDSLTHLCLRGCTSLKYLPEMPTNIKYLNLSESGIKELPQSIWSHENISYLNISHCNDLEKLPSNMCKLKVSGSFYLAHNCNHGQCSCLHYQLEMSYAITSCSLSR